MLTTIRRAEVPREPMAAEHGPIEALAQGAVPLWEELAAEPGRLAALRPALGRAALGLERLFAAHMPQEETVLFPALRRYLGAEALEEIVSEMRARREGPPVSGPSSP